jgi:transitional endoplasmic reticulum ATPase
MNALRRLLPQVDFSQRHIPYELLAQLEVNMENFQEALREVEPSAIREVFVEVPNVGWDDVGGLQDVKQRLREAVEWPMKYGDLFRSFHLSPPKGLLLSGPPGCGKTLIAKALASETEVNFISVKGPELMSMYVGESERGVREVFHKARQAAPCIVFFDEIDAMASTRGGGGHQDAGVGGRVLSQLLTELDGIEELKGVLVLAATNRRDLLDPALLRPGRFDLQIELPLPDQSAREKIFQVHLRDRPLAKEVTARWLAEQTQGFSGAEIEGVCHRAMMSTLASRIEAAPEQPDATGVEIRQEHLQTAIEELRPRMARVEHE